MARLCEAYRPTISGKKRYRPLFVNLLNTTVVAAWKIYCQIGDKKITYIDFGRQVTLCLLKGQQHREIESNVAAELPLNVHFDGVNHFLGPATTQGRRRMCKKNTKSMCTKCNIRLHGERGKTCFKTYHISCKCINMNKAYFSHNLSVSVTFNGKT